MREKDVKKYYEKFSWLPRDLLDKCLEESKRTGNILTAYLCVYEKYGVTTAPARGGNANGTAEAQLEELARGLGMAAAALLGA